MAYVGVIPSAPALLASSSSALIPDSRSEQTMQPEVYKRMAELCEKIQLEKDPRALTRLIEELTRLLEDEANPARSLPTKKFPATSG
jgi:hypothetical protein